MALNIRKIETAEESERKRKRNNLILSSVMISILLFSTAGYFSLRDETPKDSTEKVENVGDSWILKYGNQNIRLTNSPESGADVDVNLNVFSSISSYSGKIVYVSSDYDAGLYEISSTLGRYTERLQESCYGKCNLDLPEKDCNDTMIVIKSLENMTEAGSGKVYEQDNCVFIEGGLAAVDAFLYKIFGIN